jgi:hypothetical protein
LVLQITIHIQRLLLFPMGMYLLSVELIVFCYMGFGSKPFRTVVLGRQRVPADIPIGDVNIGLAGAPIPLKPSKPLLQDTSEYSQAAASTLD